jgi:hypothetical protein
MIIGQVGALMSPFVGDLDGIQVGSSEVDAYNVKQFFIQVDSNNKK